MMRLTKTHFALLILIFVATLAGHSGCRRETPPSAHNAEGVTAIDFLLTPDETMVHRAEEANAMLRGVYPQGFALDATHRPHVSCLQRYVRTADLDKVYAAVEKVLAEEQPARWQLTAHGYYYLPWPGEGLAGITVKPTDDLLRFQQKLVEAVAPFTVETGTAAAYVTTRNSPEVNASTIDYVAKYVPNETGEKFNPHVTIGLAPAEYLDKLIAEPFDSFTFSPVGLAVYHLGNFGTARQELKSWSLKP